MEIGEKVSDAVDGLKGLIDSEKVIAGCFRDLGKPNIAALKTCDLPDNLHQPCACNRGLSTGSLAMSAAKCRAVARRGHRM
jgi:hypothetical protein